MNRDLRRFTRDVEEAKDLQEAQELHRRAATKLGAAAKEAARVAADAVHGGVQEMQLGKYAEEEQQEAGQLRSLGGEGCAVGLLRPHSRRTHTQHRARTAQSTHRARTSHVSLCFARSLSLFCVCSRMCAQNAQHRARERVQHTAHTTRRQNTQQTVNSDTADSTKHTQHTQRTEQTEQTEQTSSPARTTARTGLSPSLARTPS
eukprot:3426616-Rhodomonas_salina.1